MFLRWDGTQRRPRWTDPRSSSLPSYVPIVHVPVTCSHCTRSPCQEDSYTPRSGLTPDRWTGSPTSVSGLRPGRPVWERVHVPRGDPSCRGGFTSEKETQKLVLLWCKRWVKRQNGGPNKYWSFSTFSVHVPPGLHWVYYGRPINQVFL